MENTAEQNLTNETGEVKLNVQGPNQVKQEVTQTTMETRHRDDPDMGT